MDVIASFMVLPNRLCFPLIDQVKVDQMRFPLPRVSAITVSVKLQLIITEFCKHRKAKLCVQVFIPIKYGLDKIKLLLLQFSQGCLFVNRKDLTSCGSDWRSFHK